MGSAITLRNIIGETKYLFVITIVPLHGDFNADLTSRGTFARFCSLHVNDTWMNRRFVAINILNKTLNATRKGKVFVFTASLIDQLDANTMV